MLCRSGRGPFVVDGVLYDFLIYRISMELVDLIRSVVDKGQLIATHMAFGKRSSFSSPFGQ